MMTTTLGRTGPTVSRLGLGLAALGRPGYINLGHAEDLGGDYSVSMMQASAHRVLDAAWAAGVRYFDAARSYGRAEDFLGDWLRTRQVAADAVVGSKWGYTYTAGWQVSAERHEVKEHTLPVLVRQWQESRQRLGMHLRLYQIHSATLDSGVLDACPVLEELARLRSEGLLIGLSLSGPAQADTLRRALEVRIAGMRLFDCVQATWNLLETSAAQALAEAHAAGVGVIIKEALANGRLTSRNPEPHLQPFMKLAQDLAVPPDALALAAALAQPWADVVLSGAATVEHLHSNLAASRINWHEDLEAKLAPLQEDAQMYWQARGRLAWN